VTPVCAGEKRGTEIVGDFFIETPPVGTTCGNVTGVNFTSVTSTSFVVNWTLPAGGIWVDIYVRNLATQNEISFLQVFFNSKFIDNLIPGTEYAVRVVTHCDDNSNSGGTTSNVTTSPAPSAVAVIIYNNHATLSITDFEIDGERVITPPSGNYTTTWGTVPVTPAHIWRITGLPVGTHDLRIYFDNSGYTGTVAVYTQTTSTSLPISGAVSLMFFGVAIGSGGVEVNVNP
jgi:hypothetical protein